MRRFHSVGRSALFLVSCGAVLAADAVAPSVANVASELETIRAKYKLPALAALALRGDTIVAEGHVGVRKLGTDTAITRDDRFHLGSDTKAMTATLFGLAVDQGRVTWTTTL